MAIVGFLSPLSVAVFGPACGQSLDLTPRRTALRFIITAQIAAIATAGLSLPCRCAGVSRGSGWVLTALALLQDLC